MTTNAKGGPLTLFTQRALQVIKGIPKGNVLTYGRVAALAGKPRGARQVSRLLHAMSEKHDLPWHRVINARGKISLKPSHGYELQRALLASEGIKFTRNDTIELSIYQWDGPVQDSFIDI
ncbi:MAG: MGMT family protein [Desulfobacterium sp.]|nr:MGMT family protein [Desulfobacterium sp.]